MSEYLSKYKKRPKSRSEVLARDAKVEERMARLAGELPPQATIFERVKNTISNKVLKKPQE